MEESKLISVLDKSETSDLLIGFLDSCVREVCGNSGPTFEQFIDIGWTDEEYKYMYTLIRGMFTDSTALHLDRTKMRQEFLDLPDSIQTLILQCMKDNQEVLVDAVVKDYSQRHTKTMTDFDWRLKMVMGSSKLASLREPLLQLDLKVMENETESILDLEMNKDELDIFIKALESAI